MTEDNRLKVLCRRSKYSFHYCFFRSVSKFRTCHLLIREMYLTADDVTLTSPHYRRRRLAGEDMDRSEYSIKNTTES